MKLKPAGLGPEYSTQFNDASVVAAYKTRPPYPERLVSLIVEVAGADRPRILDLGCGTGELARRLAARGVAITAIDQSSRMIAEAKRLPGGDAASIMWVNGAIEDVALSGAFDLALAAESFHWFDWARVSSRIAEVVRGGKLLLVEGRNEEPAAWTPDLRALIVRYSTNREFEPYSLVEELSARACLALHGQTPIGPDRFTQSVDDYVTSIHSRNGFSRDRMTAADASGLDAAMRALLAPHSRNGLLELEISTHVAWGQALVAV